MLGKVVLITAGASGIGRAMAEEFEATGAQIWIADISNEALQACPNVWHKHHVDVSNEHDMAGLFAKLQEQAGRLDVLCANAGTAGATALLENQPAPEFRACLEVNIMGAFLASRGALPMMKKQGGGSIIFTSSTAGNYGFPYRTPYCASKWAINGIMKTIAMEAGPQGVRANTIAPGCVEGPRIDSVIEKEAAEKNTSPEAVRRAYEQGTSLRRFVSAQDIAKMAVFLASDAAKMVSGQVISVDGHTENPDPKV